MTWTTLISAGDLAVRLEDPAVVVVDCRFNLDDTEWGRRAYESAHVPGAVYAHLGDDLAGAMTGTNGRHPLPDPRAFMGTLGRMGITRRSQVVAYDQDVGMYASRLWWMLRWLGHRDVAVLDGGFANWVEAGRATSAGVERRAPTEFVGEVQRQVLATADEVSVHVTQPDWRILDARAPERFRGDVEPLDRVAGHIPGAINHFYRKNLTDGGTFRSPEALRQLLEAALGGSASDRLVCYCGSGVTACMNLLALEHAGLHGAQLYAGSWSEWSSDPSRPVGTGGAP